MNIAASAVTELIAPSAPPPSAPPREDQGSRFQDHLDATRAQSNTQQSRTQDKPSKPAKADNSEASQDTQDSTDTTDTETTAQAQASDKSDKAAHALIVQVLPEEPPQTPQQAAPQEQPAATPQQQAPQQAQVQVQQTQPTPAPATQKAVSPKPGKAEIKTEESATRPTDARDAQPEAQPASAAPAPTPAPAPPATPILQTPAPVAVVANQPTGDDPAIGAVQANGRNITPQAPLPQAPLGSAPGREDVPKPDLPQTGKTSIAPGAKAAVNAPDFGELMHAKGAMQSEGSAPASPAAAGAAATQTATPFEGSAIDATASRSAAAAPVSGQLAREIVRRANGDNTRFELRLDPPELGKIQVQLDVSRDHKVTAIVSADNPQALSDLSRGARDLQQALQSAGLDLADDGLSFNLSNSQNGFSQPDQSNGNGGDAGASARGQSASNQTPSDIPTPRARPLSIESWRGARIDVMA